MTIDELNILITHPEGQRLEFKAARNQFSHEKDLPNYCAALANEGGGRLILGVNTQHEIVGTKAFIGTDQTISHSLLRQIGIRVEVEAVDHQAGRVLIFHVPTHRPGTPVKSNGTYWMRAGESLVEMDDQTLRRILNEGQPDYSSQSIPGGTMADLDPEAIATLHRLCFEKSKHSNFQTVSDSQFLCDLGLVTHDSISYAALILMGTPAALRRHIPQTEIIFEWRQIPGKTNYDFRQSWQAPFLQIVDNVWDEIDRRNLITPYREGFIQREIKAFDRDSIREAILNAVAHREYQMSGEVIFIYGSPDGLRIESPGGFMPGVTAENAIRSHAWRNPLIAQTLEKAGLVERAGQGLDLIYELCIRDGKGIPGFGGSDDYHVRFFVPAQVIDPEFVLFLQHIANERQISFSFDELFELEMIREKQYLSTPIFRDKFLKSGIIEQTGHGRGTQYILTHRYFQEKGKTGVHTRLQGLPRELKKEFILKHLKQNTKGTFQDFVDLFPDLGSNKVTNLLTALKREGKIRHEGSRKQGYWCIIE